jgi:hypothetical protein
MKYCQNCGFEMPETAKFCGKCKTAFTAPAQSDAPQATPPPTQQAAQQPAPSIPVAYQQPPQVENVSYQASPKKKIKKKLIIVIATVLLILGGIIFVIFNATACDAPDCKGRTEEGAYCPQHTCRLFGCRLFVPSEQDFCSTHTCKFGDCNNETDDRYSDNYCRFHTCWERDCTEGIVDDNGYCSSHTNYNNNQGATTDTGTTANSTIPAENVENNLIGKWVGQATVVDEFGRYGEFILEFFNDGTGHYYAIYSGYEGNYEIVWSLSDVDMVEYRSVSGVNSFTWRIINLNSNELVLGISEIEVHFKKDF